MTDTTSTDITTLKASCLCGSAKHEINLPTSALPLKAFMCHCNTCRHMTGTLALTVVSLPKSYQPSPTLISKLQPFIHSQFVTQLFCPVCGTYMLSRCTGDDPDGGVTWDVLTGSLEKADGIFDVQAQGHINDTLDGGFADFLSTVDGRDIERYAREIGNSEQLPIGWKEPSVETQSTKSANRLHAHCKCGGVEFWIGRPSRSTLEKAPVPDILIPFHEQSSHEPDKELWWLCENGTKYLAGLCSCNSCRLACGMEWVAWAFVPTADITLDSAGLEPFNSSLGKLRAYQSSPGVTRQFCGGCGATIFWHGEERPELIDVAVGVLDAPEGARAESWLYWRTWRLSYREDSVTRAKGLTLGVEEGLKNYGNRR